MWVSIPLLALVASLSSGFMIDSNVTHPSEDPTNIRSFAIDYEANTFLLDGVPFRYVSGSFHYFRTLPQRWRPILRTMRAGGLNAVDIYVHWALHNPKDGVYNWEGIADLEDVIKAADEAGLYVILRPGPYICAELDNGGIPYWLFTKHPGMQVRTKDILYLSEVEKYFKQLMGRMEKYMYGKGGPIIMVQHENEYGAFGKCDRVYKDWLRMELEKYTEGHALLFTVDRPQEPEMGCGYTPGVFATTDFGLSTDDEVDSYWALLRKYQPNGPLVNSEYYTGWFSHWHETNQRRPSGPLSTTLIKILSDGASVNFYMYFGGTNFGFDSGANAYGIGEYQADITSYDYDAPLDEAGNPTPKFEMFKTVIQRFYPESVFPEAPKKRPVIALEEIYLQPKAHLIDPEILSLLNSRSANFVDPPSFEKFNQDSGFLLYETTLPEFKRDPSKLVVHGVRDRAFVFVDGLFIGTLSREHVINSLPINAGFGKKLQILVENQGRINWQVNSDLKGILGDVELQMYDEPYVTLKNWVVTGIPMDDYAALESLCFSTSRYIELDKRGILTEGPVIFAGTIDVPWGMDDFHVDLYLDMEKWGKGVIFVNGMNIGRYWPLAGPQITNYIPGELLKESGNRIIIVEYQKYNTDSYKLPFAQAPKLDGKSN